MHIAKKAGKPVDKALLEDAAQSEDDTVGNLPTDVTIQESNDAPALESAVLAAKLENLWKEFAIPFDYFTPSIIAGVGSVGLGFCQSVLASPSLEAFSLDNLLAFQLPVQSAIFGAVFLQAVAGWGFALAAIAGVSSFAPGFTVKDAQALIAVIAVPVDTGMFLPYLKSGAVNGQLVDRWVIGGLIGTPIGVIALKYLDEKIALFCLGSMLLAYCGYASYDILKCYHQSNLIDFQSDAVDSTYASSCKIAPETYPAGWVWASGLFAGLLGGAFDAPGPPLVVFADLTGLANNAKMTRANLLAFFALESQLVAVTDLLDGRYANGSIWPTILLALPSMFVGNLAGNWCGQFVDQEKFRWVVIGLLGTCGLHQIGAI